MKRFPTKACFDVQLLYSLSVRKFVQSPVTNEGPDVFVQWYSTFFVHVPQDVISFQLCTPKVVGVESKLYAVYNLHLKYSK
jgi:hypothetical protein